MAAYPHIAGPAHFAGCGFLPQNPGLATFPEKMLQEEISITSPSNAATSVDESVPVLEERGTV